MYWKESIFCFYYGIFGFLFVPNNILLLLLLHSLLCLFTSSLLRLSKTRITVILFSTSFNSNQSWYVCVMFVRCSHSIEPRLTHLYIVLSKDFVGNKQINIGRFFPTPYTHNRWFSVCFSFRFVFISLSINLLLGEYNTTSYCILYTYKSSIA